MQRAVLAVIVLVVALGAACKGRSNDAASAAPGAPAAAPIAEGELASGEVFHSLDRKAMQSFGRGGLAVGGGWVYWLETPRAGAHDAVVRRKPAANPAAAPETVAGPGPIVAIAADAERFYVAGELLQAKPHGDGYLAEVAAGAWIEIVPSTAHLLIRSRDRVAIVGKTGGTVDTVWEGKHGKLSVDADGDRFIAIPVSPWAQKSAARAITVYAPGAKPHVIAELAQARGDLAVDGDWIYFGGTPAGDRMLAPLWRIARGGGAAEPVGDPAWGFGEFIADGGTLYGMVFTDAWRLQKLALAGRARPQVLDGRLPGMVQALAADDRHLYYLTDFDVKRAAR